MTKKTNNRTQNQKIHHSDHTNAYYFTQKTVFEKEKKSCFQKKTKIPMKFKSKKNFPTKNMYSLNNKFLIKLGIF